MGIGKKLSDLIAEKKTNVRALSIKTGVAPTTIYSLINRDASKVEIDTLIKICHALDVTADYFTSEDVLADIQSSKPTPPTRKLSPSEEFLVDVYRDLNEEGKDRLVDYADDLHSMDKYKKDYKPVSAQEKSA